MQHSTDPLDPHPTPEARDARAQGLSADAPGTSASASDEAEPELGAQVPHRFAADVEYHGRCGDHDYLVRVRHRLLDTSATVVIDGVEHDPVAEAKALEQAGEPHAEGQTAGDDLRFRCEDGFASLHIVVLRPDEDGDHEDAEVIRVSTAGFGGAGEVDVRRGLERVPLVPEEGSPSAAREQERAAHPTRFAAAAALGTAVRCLIPLLGLGALLGGFLDPVTDWVAERLRPIVEAIAGFIVPIRERLSELTRPVREFLGALTRPVRELRDWLVELLFGWIPDVSLPFSVPGWVVDAAIPVLVVAFVFVVTLRRLRRRGEKLEEAREASDADGGTEASGTEDRSSTAPPRPER